MLLTLVNKINSMEKLKDSNSDFDTTDYLDWSQLIDTDLPDDVNCVDDPDFVIPEEVAENSITTSTTKSYNLRARNRLHWLDTWNNLCTTIYFVNIFSWLWIIYTNKYVIINLVIVCDGWHTHYISLLQVVLTTSNQIETNININVRIVLWTKVKCSWSVS